MIQQFLPANMFLWPKIPVFAHKYVLDAFPSQFLPLNVIFIYVLYEKNIPLKHP